MTTQERAGLTPLFRKMTKKLSFEDLFNLTPDAWSTCAQAFYERPQDSPLTLMVREHFNDSRLFSVENKHLWLDLVAKPMPELLAYLALVSHMHAPSRLGWFLDALEAHLYLQGRGAGAEEAAGRISIAFGYLSAPQGNCALLLALFAHPPQEGKLADSLAVTWLDMTRQVSGGQSEYPLLYEILHKRPLSPPAAAPPAKKEKLSDPLTPDYFFLPCPNPVSPGWVALCHRGLALWLDMAANRDAGLFRHMAAQVIGARYPAKKPALLDYVLGLWMLTQPDRALWVLEPLIKPVAESANPAGLFLQLFEMKSYAGAGTFCHLLAQSYSASQMEAMALRLIHQALTLVLSHPKDRIPRPFLKLSLEKIPAGSLESIAQWGVTQLDAFATSKQDQPLICFENVMDHVPTGVMLRQLLLLRPEAPSPPTVRLEMIPRLNPNVGLLLWGVGNDTPLALGASHQLVLAMIQDNSACPHPAFPDFFSGVLQLMVSAPPASILPLYKWTNRYLIPTILARHPLHPAYASDLLLTLLRDVSLFDLLMAGSGLKVASLDSHMALAGIPFSPHPGLKAFLELLSSELDSVAQLALARSWITLWAGTSPLLWKWKMTLITCFPLSTLSANVATGLLESIQRPCLDAIPNALSDVFGLMKFVLVSGGCSALFPLVYQTIQRLSESSMGGILCCIEEAMLSSFLASDAAALDPGLVARAKESLLSVLGACLCVSEGQGPREDFVRSLKTQLIPRLACSHALHQTLLSILVSAWYDLLSKDLSARAFYQRLVVASCRLIVFFLEHLEVHGPWPHAIQSLYNIPCTAHHPKPLVALKSSRPTVALLFSTDLYVVLTPLLEKLKRLLPHSPSIEMLYST